MEENAIRVPLMVNNQFVATYNNGKQLCDVCVSLKEDEAICVIFEKGYVVVKTQYETKFVCKGKAFISLWKN